MNIIKPLQLMGQQTVIEQDSQFHFVASVSLGFNLADGKAMLEMDTMRESIAAMGDNPVPDFGMPKPQAEYLVSGSYFAPGGEAVAGGEVRVEFASQQKTLYVFGDREWDMGIPTNPALISEMPIDYSRAFGGNNYSKNPVGIGYEDSRLPNIENPQQLLNSPKDNIPPAGFGVLDMTVDQRRRFQGTYDDRYMEQYYPGYPADFDWRYFMNTAEDQWSPDFYVGNETYAIYNMHPEKPVISGRLPDFQARCFAAMENKSELLEVDLKLDTVWLFPGCDLGMLIWRGGFLVDDDEAENIQHLMLAYENRLSDNRDKSYYQSSFDTLVASNDPLLSQLSSDDLIPSNEKCAMEIIQENAYAGSEESAFGKNLDAKAKNVASMTQKKLDEAMAEIKSRVPESDQVENKELLNLENMLNNPPTLELDKDQAALNLALEKILPGITNSGGKPVSLKGFTFDKIDEIMLEIEKFMAKKQDFSLAQVEILKNQLQDELSQSLGSVDSADTATTEQLKKTIAELDELGKAPPSPLPRADAESILAELDQLSPQIIEATQQLQAMKAMGGSDEYTQQLETVIKQSTIENDEALKTRMAEMEREFKSMYRDSAHFLTDGLPPHKISIEERRQAFLDSLKAKQPVRDRDWAGLNLSQLDLTGVDLSNAYLEQVDFSGSNLTGANLSGAILARANLADANFSHSNFEAANVGAVKASNANFAHCNLGNAALSKGDFSNAKFTQASLESIQSLEIIASGADFTGANLKGIQLIDVKISGAIFVDCNLEAACFLQSKFEGCNFTGANLKSSTWADTSVSSSTFDRADMTSACFAARDAEIAKLDQVSFVGARLNKANFQGVDMQRADLSSASLVNSNFSSANLYGANLSGVIAHSALFRKAILSNANLEKIDLREGSLAKAHLSGANVSDANMYSVDFLRATMGDTLFTSSNLDNTIIQNWRPS